MHALSAGSCPHGRFDTHNARPQPRSALSQKPRDHYSLAKIIVGFDGKINFELRQALQTELPLIERFSESYPIRAEYLKEEKLYRSPAP